jgi:hypothetical protein
MSNYFYCLSYILRDDPDFSWIKTIDFIWKLEDEENQ